MNFWLVSSAEQDVPCVSAHKQIWGGREAGRTQRGGREPLSQYGKPVRISEALDSEKQWTVSSLFLPLICSLGIKLLLSVTEL